MPQRRTVLLLSLALGLFAPGCLSPTLPPLPPPAQPSLVQNMGQGEVLIEGTVPLAEAKVLLLNRTTEQIVGALVHDGSYSLLIRAELGDRVDLWYSSSGVDSPVIGFNIAEGASRPSDAGQ
jgi:hypothetical protein